MSDDKFEKIEQEDLEKVSGGRGINDVNYEPTHDLEKAAGSIGDVIYEPTHDLVKKINPLKK